MNISSRYIPEVPSSKDPRWLHFGIVLCFVAYTLSLPTFGRDWIQLFVTFFTAISIDYLFSRANEDRPIFPLSSMIMAIGICFLTYSSEIWPFFVIASISVLSKKLIRFQGLHIFNPNNFGIVLALVFIGEHITTNGGRWPNSLYMSMTFIALGAYTTYRVKRLDLSIIFISAFALFAFSRSLISGSEFRHEILFATGPLFFLYAFFHISDPITTPSNRSGKIIFAISLALIDSILRSYRVIYSPFYALFILTLIQPFFPRIFIRYDSQKIWRETPS